MKNQYGDFQTNDELAKKACLLLKNLGANPDTIIEPTCGVGSFVVQSSLTFTKDKEIIGIEIQDEYAKESIKRIKQCNPKDKVKIINTSIFEYNFNDILKNKDKEILLIGNPPRVTNSDLNGNNLPKKSNFKKSSWLDAITGKANFDISEYILLDLLEKFNNRNGYLAFLCKTHVVKNIMQFLPTTQINASDFRIYLFDSKKEFNVDVESCLFICKLSWGNESHVCRVFDIENPNILKKTFGWYNDKFVADIEKYIKYQKFDGNSKIIWRSGVKHDCSSIMELDTTTTGQNTNKLGEIINIEDDLIFPLLKSSYIKGWIIEDSNKKIILTQRKPGEETNFIAIKYPKTWNYLNSHKKLLDNRKSSIYKKAPNFAIFWIGDYSFAPYKIAISGLYKKPNFTLLLPKRKEIMVDDSCYFIGFKELKHALIAFSILNSKETKDFLESIVFIDAKRPYTKDILMRIDLDKILNHLEIQHINKDIKEMWFNEYKINEQDLILFSNALISEKIQKNNMLPLFSNKKRQLLWKNVMKPVLNI